MDNIRFVNNIVSLNFHLRTKDSSKLKYLELSMTKRVDDIKPFEYKVIHNELNKKIEIERILDKFLYSFYWEEGGVLLSDFFEL